MRKLFTALCTVGVFAAACTSPQSDSNSNDDSTVNTDHFTWGRHHAPHGWHPRDLGSEPEAVDLARPPVEVADLATPPHHVDMATPPPPPPPPTTGPASHTRCGWIDDPTAEASFVTNAAQFNAIHPKWYTLNSDGVTINQAGNPDKPSIVAAAAANHVRIIPLIDAEDVTALRKLINSPTLIAQHTAAMVALMKAHGYAGMDIDYEHLWTKADRPGYSALMTSLSNAFHANGFELSMALTPLGFADSGNNGYDYSVLANVCDTLHFMGYDFHYVGGDHLGPLAPLGWLDASFKLAEATGHVGKFMVGLGNYAIGNNYYTTALDAAAQCTSGPATTTNHMLTCPYGNYTAGRALSCPTASHGTLWFEDVASMEEKVQNALSHGARGVTYWTLGSELPGYFTMVKKYYP